MPRSGDPSPHRADHGTAAAYKRHLTLGEIPCEPCREFNREYAQRRRDRIKDGTLNVRVPLKALQQLWEVAPPEMRYALKPSLKHLFDRAEYNFLNKPDGRHDPHIPGEVRDDP